MQKANRKDLHFDSLKKIGEALRKLRKEKGYSNYHKLAYDLDMAHSQYGDYENGKTNMTVNTLLKILAFHGISLKEFVKDYL